MKYESVRDIELRLKHTLVMHKKRPCVVIDVRGENSVVVQDTLTGRSSETTLEELDLEPANAPLGYVIGEDEQVYVAMRKPARKFKQGLSQDTLHIKPVLQGRSEGRLGRPVSYGSKQLARTILGQFPSIGDAFQAVWRGDKKVVPFSREWAVAETEGDVCIVFRGEVVGYCKDNAACLLPEKFYLKESLEVALV